MALLTGAYEATRFKNKPAQSHLASAALLGLGTGSELDAAVARGAGLAKGVTLAKWGLLDYPWSSLYITVYEKI